MTQSLYVPGTLVDVGNVLVDIGTGYFVTKTNDQAKDFLQRKITLLCVFALFQENFITFQEFLKNKSTHYPKPYDPPVCGAKTQCAHTE